MQWFLSETGDGEFFPNNEFIVEVGKEFCHSAIDEVCSNVLFLICGFDETNVNSVCQLISTVIILIIIYN